MGIQHISSFPQGVEAVLQHHSERVVDVEEQFYLKPDAGKLLISPADETLSEPCDAQPEELDIAICVDRIQTAFDLQIRRIDHKWAGLRSFLPGGDPMAGYDPDAPGFFWLAGQGGYGIQSAPAMARSAAALVQGLELPGDVADLGVTITAPPGKAISPVSAAVNTSWLLPWATTRAIWQSCRSRYSPRSTSSP